MATAGMAFAEKLCFEFTAFILQDSLPGKNISESIKTYYITRDTTHNVIQSDGKKCA